MNRFQMKCRRICIAKRLNTFSNIHYVSFLIPKIKEQPTKYKMSYVIGKKQQDVTLIGVWLLHQH